MREALQRPLGRLEGGGIGERERVVMPLLVDDLEVALIQQPVPLHAFQDPSPHLQERQCKNKAWTWQEINWKRNAKGGRIIHFASYN
eukprot:scaffold348805_cov26-Prasinocladus_malaysianus.AAC.1